MKERKENHGSVTAARRCSYGATQKVKESRERYPAQTALLPLQIPGEKAGNRLDIDDESVSL